MPDEIWAHRYSGKTRGEWIEPNADDRAEGSSGLTVYRRADLAPTPCQPKGDVSWLQLRDAYDLAPTPRHDDLTAEEQACLEAGGAVVTDQSGTRAEWPRSTTPQPKGGEPCAHGESTMSNNRKRGDAPSSTVTQAQYNAAPGSANAQPEAQWPDEATVKRAAIALGQFIAELPDRTSPEDDPGAMTIYESEVEGAAVAALLAAGPQPPQPEWRPIESAPDKGRILLAAWHGGIYTVVEAKRIGDGWHGVAEDSSVGWHPKHPHKAYWIPFPAPPGSGPIPSPPKVKRVVTDEDVERCVTIEQRTFFQNRDDPRASNIAMRAALESFVNGGEG